MNTDIQTTINQLSRRLYIIDEEMESSKRYKELIEEGFEHLRRGFEIKELRECPISFKFHKNDPNTHKMQLRHFLVNLIFWEPLIKLKIKDDINESYIIQPSSISSGYIKKYIDTKIIIPFRHRVSNKKLNKLLSELIHNLGRISTEFNILIGSTINVESFINMANRNERFREIIQTTLDPAMQPSEIESVIHKLTDEQVQILTNEPNVLQSMLKSGTGIKAKQLAEFSINGGLKPDLSGRTIPGPINSNFLYSGTNTVDAYFKDVLGARKSLIFNKSVMGKSGHFARKAMLVVSDIKLREDTDPCGSVHPIMYTVRSAEYLRRLVGRTYRLPNEAHYHTLSENDTHVIGQQILVKSPMTCASHEGVCAECYGEMLHHTNTGVGIGAYAGAYITEPVTQSILSSKHLLTTTSVAIEFDEKVFNTYFVLNANEVMLNTETDIDLGNYSLIIMKEDLNIIENLDEGEITDFLTKFYIRNDETGELITIQENKNMEMYLSPELKSIMKLSKKQKGVYEINLTSIPDDTRLFLIQVDNAELTRPLYKIMGLLDGKEQRIKLNLETLSDYAQALLDLLIESKIDVQAVHAEVLLSSLIRSKEDVLKKPAFKKYDAIADTQVLTVSSALEKHPSALVGISFQYLGRQLLNPLTFRKTGTSFLDPFFSETLGSSKLA